MVSRLYLTAALLAAPMLSPAARASAAEPARPPLSGVELAPRSGPAGSTLFQPMPATETGISAPNLYADPKMWAERYREFSLGAIGTGVAIGDFDGDGWPDVFVVRKTEPDRLFRNLGGFRFEDVTDRAGVGGPVEAWKQGAAAADLNNDGHLDLYVTRFNAPNLLYLNRGDGTFREAARERGLDVVSASGMACFADYDRDGRLDLYLQTNLLDAEANPYGERDRMLHQNADGTFTDVTERAGLFGKTQGHSATWWDFDEDGWPDIYVANDFKDPDQLYRNRGDGTFGNVLSFVVPHTPHSSMGADLGDLNNDGRVDLLVADMARTSRSADHRGMAKIRAGLMENSTNPEAAPQFMRNALYLNTGTGLMQEAAFLAGLDATDWTWSVRMEDLDNDGRLDVFFTTGMVRELDHADVVTRTSALESLAARTKLWKSTPPLAQRTLVYQNLGDLRFAERGAAWGLAHPGVHFGAAFGDLDRDGDLDLVFAGYETDVIVARNDSDAGHRVLFDLRGPQGNRYGIGAVVKIRTAAGVQVRPLVLARGYLSTSEPVVHFGLGDAATIDEVTVEWPSGHRQEFRQVAADRRYVVREPADAPPPLPRPQAPRLNPQFVDTTREQNLVVVSRDRPVDETARQPLLPLRHNRMGPAAVAADLDGDGEDDLVFGGATGERTQRVMNLGAGQFLPPVTTGFGGANEVTDAAVLAFEANGDGHLDLLVGKGGVARDPGHAAYQPRLFLNDGGGRFDAAPAGVLPAWTESTGGAAAADFDRDGTVDLFLGGRVVPGGYPAVPRSALWARREGRWVDVTETVAPELRSVGMVTAALWSDVDGDGWLDLLVTLDWGAVAYFHNDGGQRFEDWTARAGFAAAGTGWWNSLASGDLNGDGRPDYIAGNLGLNTKYRASPRQPSVLFAGDFDGSGRDQLIEAQYEGEVLYPVRALPQLQAVLPALTKKFPTFERYAHASVEAVIPAERLAAARKLTATELRSGVFLSRPDGTYAFAPLPRIAQIAPVFGIAVTDFDGDGHADVYVVHNSFAPIAETGRFDGGLSQLLRGDGRGGLSPVAPADSGLLVPHEAKAAVVSDFNRDGWPDLLVTRNNHRPVLFRNRAVPSRHSFGVSLRGPAGNPTAVGARISVTLRDGRTQSQEVTAGAGYLSQSSAARFFGYEEGNEPREVVVRWPEGRTTSQAWTTAAPLLVLTSPSP